jgi:membrane protease YdiL (CAAX protease family)
MSEERKRDRLGLIGVGFIVASWFLLTWLAPYYSRLLSLRRIHFILPAYLRMTLMYLVTWVYVRFREKKTFGPGFNFSFRRLGRTLLWGVIIAVVATAVLEAYQAWVVVPLTRRALEASSQGPAASVAPFWSRLVDYLYIVYEGIVEVLIFIGFLLDRLAARWKPWLALVVSNVVFALWHYAYWRMGLLEGSLMILLTFIAGSLISLGYLKTRNSLTAVVSHILIDTPSAVKELLGLL